MEKPRVYTVEEVQQRVFEHIWGMIDYWEKLPNRGRESGEWRERTVRDRLEGLTHSILAMLDGSTLDLPGFQLIPFPHPSDQAYCESEGENWFPPSQRDPNDIGGGLAGLLYHYQPKRVAPDGSDE